MNKLDVTYSPAVRESASVWPVVRTATEWLEGMLGESNSVVKAEWDVTPVTDPRPVITLKLSDFTSPDGIVGRFRPDELSDRVAAERRFYRLYGDFLQNQSHVLLNQFSGGGR